MNPLSYYRLKREMATLRPRLYQLAWAWCHNQQRADDLVQETLLRGLDRLKQLRDSSKLEPWLIRIMVNIHRDQLQQQARQSVETIHDDYPSNADGPEHLAQRAKNIQQVLQAIERLSDEQRMVLALVDLMEHSYAEVAEILDIPMGTVMSRLCRARSQLKELLNKPTKRTNLRLVK